MSSAAEPHRHGEARVNPPDTIDTEQPSVARCYDAMLGGKDNFAIDRAFVADVLRRIPSMHTVTVDNREWLVRVVRYLTEQVGIDQFLDCGAGLPTTENTHQVAQRINREATVVYIDNDPAVLAYGRALLEENEYAHLASADLRKPAELFANPIIAKRLDFTRPIGILHMGSLHHAVDADRPYEIMDGYIDAVPSGSYVAISHFLAPGTNDELAAAAAELEEFLLRGLGTGRFRTKEQITRFFDRLELLEPGVTLLRDWWPNGPRQRPLEQGQRLMLGGVGRKP